MSKYFFSTPLHLHICTKSIFSISEKSVYCLLSPLYPLSTKKHQSYFLPTLPTISTSGFLPATNLCHAEISASFPSAGSDSLLIHSLLFPRFFWLYSCKMSNYLLPFGHHVQTQIIFFTLTFGQFVQTQKYRCFSLSCLDIMSKRTIFVPFFINFNVYL